MFRTPPLPGHIHNSPLIDKLIQLQREAHIRHNYNLSKGLSKAVSSIHRYPLPITSVITL